MKDIWDSAKVAASETASTFRHLFGLLAFATIFIAVAAGLVATAYFGIRSLDPKLPAKTVETLAVLIMILPATAFGWFAIVFSVTLEERKKKQ